MPSCGHLPSSTLFSLTCRQYCLWPRQICNSHVGSSMALPLPHLIVRQELSAALCNWRILRLPPLNRLLQVVLVHAHCQYVETGHGPVMSKRDVDPYALWRLCVDFDFRSMPGPEHVSLPFSMPSQSS